MFRLITFLLGLVLVLGAGYFLWPDGDPGSELGPGGTVTREGEPAGGKTAPLHGQPIPEARRTDPRKNLAKSDPTTTKTGAPNPPVAAPPSAWAELRQAEEEWAHFVESFLEPAQFAQALADQKVMLEGAPPDKEMATELRTALVDSLKKEIGPKLRTIPGVENWAARNALVHAFFEELVPSISSGILKMKLERAHEPAKETGFREASEDRAGGKFSLRCRSKNLWIGLEVERGALRPEAWMLYERMVKRHKGPGK